ncbi:hypothetical protein AFB00_05000 [Pseudonocardia sp. HH130630-07]|nr:hypothetical protein AFB00_05000 [Pseudonocardia sp. HH130630-07]
MLDGASSGFGHDAPLVEWSSRYVVIRGFRRTEQSDHGLTEPAFQHAARDLARSGRGAGEPPLELTLGDVHLAFAQPPCVLGELTARIGVRQVQLL